MHITTVHYPLSAGKLEMNTRAAVLWLRAAVADGAACVILPPLAVGGPVSLARLRSADFQAERDRALRALAETADVPVITCERFRQDGSVREEIVVLERGSIRRSRDTVRLQISEATMDVRLTPPTDTAVPTVHLALRPYRKEAAAVPEHTLAVHMLTVEDRGKTCHIHTGSAATAAAQAGALATGLRDWRLTNGQFLPLVAETPPARTDILAFAVRTLWQRLHLGKLLIGLSGGIDSAVNAALYAHALGRDRVIAVHMPSRFTSATTAELAATVADRLGIPLLRVPIDESVAHTVRQLEAAAATAGLPLRITGLTHENLQARNRSGRILATLAAAYGGVFSCNANKTECTVGYGTMYGDIAGAFALTADLWKHEVYALAAEYSALLGNTLPDSIFSLPPSAELSAAQNVEEGRGDPLYYPYHDYLFRAWVEGEQPLDLAATLRLYRTGDLAARLGTKTDPRQHFTPAEFVADCERWWRLYRGLAVAKRIQAPPLLALTDYAFGDIPEAQAEWEWENETAYRREKELLLSQ